MGLNREEAAKKGNVRGTYKLQEGENNLRILPPTAKYFDGDIDHIARMYDMHFRIPTAEGVAHFPCPKSFDEKAVCAACELSWSYYNLKTDEGKTQGYAVRAKHRYLFNILVKEKDEYVIKVLEVGPGIFKDILKFVLDPDWLDNEHPDNGTLIDPTYGHAVKITKYPEGHEGSEFVSYEVTPLPKQTSVMEKLPKGWKEQLDLIENFVPEAISSADVKKIIDGTPSPSVDDDPLDEGDKPEEEAKPVSDADKPDCFGDETKYDNKSTKCLECVVRKGCMEEMLGGGL